MHLEALQHSWGGWGTESGAEAECRPGVRRGVPGDVALRAGSVQLRPPGLQPLSPRGTWRRGSAQSSLSTLWEAEAGHLQAGVTQVRPLGRPAGPTLDNAARAPPPEADAARAAANHRLWLGSLKKEEPAAVWLSAGEGSLRPCKHTS